MSLSEPRLLRSVQDLRLKRNLICPRHEAILHRMLASQLQCRPTASNSVQSRLPSIRLASKTASCLNPDSPVSNCPVNGHQHKLLLPSCKLLHPPSSPVQSRPDCPVSAVYGQRHRLPPMHLTSRAVRSSAAATASSAGLFCSTSRATPGAAVTVSGRGRSLTSPVTAAPTAEGPRSDGPASGGRPGRGGGWAVSGRGRGWTAWAGKPEGVTGGGEGSDGEGRGGEVAITADHDSRAGQSVYPPALAVNRGGCRLPVQSHDPIHVSCDP